MVEHNEWGWTGGLLVLNVVGRPLEFHCTAPVKPNRAQEILYGPTLRPFLYGEQIGQALLTKVKSETLFVCTDVEHALCVREFVSLPVVWVHDQGATAAAEPDPRGTTRSYRVDAAHDQHRPAFCRLTSFLLGKQSVAVLEPFAADRETVVERWQPYQDHWDIVEPFVRIREALEEAQRGAVK